MMKRTKSTFFALSIAMIAVLVSAPVVLGVETTLTDYSRAVMLENPTYYWTFNEADTAAPAQEVMRTEDAAAVTPYLDATRVSSYSEALGNAASFNGNATFWGGDMDNRGKTVGAYAVEYWFKSPTGSTGGYVLDPLGAAVGGNQPAIIHGFSTGYTEMFAYPSAAVGIQRTGTASELYLNDGQWHHVVMAVNNDADLTTNDRIDIAIDGTVISNFASLNMPQFDLSGAMCFGACKPIPPGGTFASYATGPEAGGVWDGFTGQIDEFAIYDLSDMDATAVASKVSTLAGHYALASSPTEITPFAAVAAEDVSYSVIGGDPINTAYDDTGGTELSDTVYCSAVSVENAVGFSGADTYTELEFNLGDVSTLDAVWINYLGPGGKWGIHAPESVELSFSTDGVNYSNAVTFEDFNDESDGPYNEETQTGLTYWNERLAQVDVDSIDAQYIRAKFNHDGTFLFLSEVQFMEEIQELLAGDANGDGKVDGSDVTILANNWQAGVNPGDDAATWEMGDFNGDGKVDGSDVTILANNWQSGVDAVGSAVPEPGTIVLLFSAIASLLIWRRAR